MTWRTDLIDGPIPSYQFLGLDEEENPMFGDLLPAYNLNVAPNVMTEELEAYLIEPSQPKRQFSGAETVFLTFTDEAEARAALAKYSIEEST